MKRIIQKKWDDVPQLGEIIYLRENFIISTGGDSIPFSYKQLAIRAVKAAGATF